MTENFPYMKYIFISIVFILAFFCMFNSNLEMVGLCIVFIMQFIFSYCVVSDIYKEETNTRYTKKLTFNGNVIEIMLYLFIFAGLSLHFVGLLLLMITMYHLHKKYSSKGKGIQLSRENRGLIETFKPIYVCITVLFMILIGMYFYADIDIPYKFVGWKRLIVLISVLGILSLSSINIYIANKTTKLIQSSTDG